MKQLYKTSYSLERHTKELTPL